jgi:hypothetical protein
VARRLVLETCAFEPSNRANRHDLRDGTPDAVGASMRAVIVMSLVLATTPAWAGNASRPSYRGRGTEKLDERTLSAAEIERYAAPYLPAVKQCYVEHGRSAPGSTGQLALELIVHRDGAVADIKVEAPGVTGRRLRKLSRCIQTLAETWQFPVRRDSTTAVLPYYFLHLAVPGSGPQQSCWNPKGCPRRQATPRR